MSLWLRYVTLGALAMCLVTVFIMQSSRRGAPPVPRSRPPTVSVTKGEPRGGTPANPYFRGSLIVHHQALSMQQSPHSTFSESHLYSHTTGTHLYPPIPLPLFPRLPNTFSRRDGTQQRKT